MKTKILAVMFTDIVGYTQRTSRQTYEENAALLERHAEIVHPILKRFSGTVVKEIGDAVLATFSSPTRAVEAAMAVQDRLAELNQGRPSDEQLHLRIAVNVGEVRITRGDVFGEGVNVAARIEAETPRDEIYISGSTYLTMNRNNIPLEFLGQRSLKGVSEPVTIFSLPRFATQDGETVITTKDAVTLPYRGQKLAQLATLRRQHVRQLVCAVALAALAVGGGAYAGIKHLWQSHEKNAARAALASHDFRRAATALKTLVAHGVEVSGELELVLRESHAIAGTDLSCRALALFAELLRADPALREANGRERLYQALALTRAGELAQARECLQAVAFAPDSPEARLAQLDAIHLGAAAALRARAVLDLKEELKRYEDFLQKGSAPDEHLAFIAEVVADAYAFPKTRPVADSLVVDYLRDKAAAALAKRAISPASPDTARMWIVARLEKTPTSEPLDWAAIYTAQLAEGLCSTRRAAIEGLRKLARLDAAGVLLREAGRHDRCTVAAARDAAADLIANADANPATSPHAAPLVVATR
ncbi:MAG: adenylate/guanylate cyclase domain-containing protein [Deltaproteobacteria bacterium]|nr:adenylate/guanylate cyclase domain-containing protein [Deltaproteobacteria bacterium]